MAIMTNEQTYDVIVIGGGPAGLMAAGQAAAAGAKTLLLEKMAQTGAKLRITGKGRCNLTNIAEQEDFLAHFGRQGLFLRQAFARFFRQDLLEFLTAIGIQTQSERGGRIFPSNMDAIGVADKLTQWALAQGVEIQYRMPVKAIRVEHEKDPRCALPLK